MNSGMYFAACRKAVKFGTPSAYTELVQVIFEQQEPGFRFGYSY